MNYNKISKYDLMTLNPERIINQKVLKEMSNGHYEWCFELDFRKGTIDENRVLISTDSFNENALLRQIFIVLQENDKKIEKTEDILKYHLFFLDFSKLFRYKKELHEDYNIKEFEVRVNSGLKKENLYGLNWNEMLFFIYRNGFDVRFDDEYRHYVPFESSASMSRACRISFINESLKEQVNDRLLLGMDLTLGSKNPAEYIELAPHKYFAYRGLYMSDGIRIETAEESPNKSNIVLNEETVIVINDATPDSKQEENVITAKEKKDCDGYWDIISDTILLKFNSFDGEGFIDPEYAKEINKQMFGTEEAANSFQIRMPYIKGMLHSVDFRQFYEKECGVSTSETTYVKDIYGILRDLSKARIILTKSMLKNNEWLKEYVSKSSKCKEGYACKCIINKDGVESEEDGRDPLKFFFTMMNKGHYNHSLFIVRTDLNLHNEEKKVKLNYQSLNTLAMDKKTFEKKILEYISYIEEIEKDPDSQREFVLGDRETTTSAWKYALSRNLTLLSEKYIQEQIRTEIESRIKDIYRGNIRVSGENRFLSGDLLALLIHIYKQTVDFDKDKVKQLNEYCIKSKCFKAPAPRVKIKEGKTYGFLRNPHLSRNEECVLNCAPRYSYDKYFEKLSGIIMIAYESYAPMTLGGADFDGDMVKLITDVDVIKAMKNGKKGCSNSSKIVVIPSEKETKVPVPKGIDYAHVKDTFGNQIGRVSNLAIRLGEQEYSISSDNKDTKKEENEQDQSIHQYIPADCTILTGLEIDSAKNGKHPRKNIEELAEQVEKKDFDYISLLKQLKASEKEQVKKRKTQKSLKNTESYEIVCDDKKKNVLIPKFDENKANIEMLMPLYFETMYSDRPKLSEIEKNSRFVFETDDRGNVTQEDIDQINAIIDIYTLYTARLRALYRGDEKRKNQNWYGKAYYIIQEQYYGRTDLEDKKKALAELYTAIEYFVCDIESYVEYGNTTKERCENIIDKIRSNEWIFAPEKQRIEMLKKILPFSEMPELYGNAEWSMILTNFTRSGYMLLYYIIRAIEQDNIGIKESDEYNPIRKKIPENSTEVYKEMYNKAFDIMKVPYEKAINRKYAFYKYDDLLLNVIFEKLMPKDISNYSKLIYEKSPSLFWKFFEGKNQLTVLKNSQIVIDYMPYKKWIKIPDVLKYEEEEEFFEEEEFE